MTADPPTVTARQPDRHLGALVAAVARAHGQRPFLTFTDGATGERTELGCATFENWTAKTANLLVEELGLGPGTVLASALGTHWTTAVITAAAWRVGAAVALPGVDAPVDAIARREDGPAVPGSAPQLLVGAGLGGRLVGDAGAAVPFAEEVLGFADDFDDVPGDPGDAALLAPRAGDAAMHTHGDLLEAATGLVRAAGLDAGDRFAVTVPLDLVGGVAAGPVTALLLGGGLLLVRATAPDALQDLLAAERCAALLAPQGVAPPARDVRTVGVPVQ